MMAGKLYSYRYEIAYPRRWNEPRLAGRVETVNAFLSLPDVVDASFPDLSASWRSEEFPAEPNNESRRRLVWVMVASASQKDADATRDRIVELALARRRDPGDVVTIVRHPVEVLSP